jgi:DNA-binding NarL/FixJ family response regulator
VTTSVRVAIAVADDQHAQRIAAVLEALGYEVVREFDGEEKSAARRRHAAERLVKRHNLTERESQVLHAILLGRTRGQIAAELDVSAATIKWHTHNLFAKIKTRNRADLLRLVHDPETRT